MDILISAATDLEIAPLQHFLRQSLPSFQGDVFFTGDNTITLAITHIGAVSTAARLSSLLSRRTYDVAVHAGIGGAFGHSLALGATVVVQKDRMADLGAELADGSFADTATLELPADSLPAWLEGDVSMAAKWFPALPCVTGITVNTVSGTWHTIEQRRNTWNADTESMEGAAFYYACALHHQPAVQIRSISNYVTPRNKDAWDILLAVRHLNETLVSFIQQVCQNTKA